MIVILGVPGVAPAEATIVAMAGSQQAQTPSSSDGSFNLALIPAVAAANPANAGEAAGASPPTTDGARTIELRILVGSLEVSHATIAVPVPDAQVAPDGATPASGTATPATKPQTSSARVDAITTHLDFPAGSFSADASVAIADLDRGTTETASAAPDGSLAVNVTAARGDTLYVVAITANAATAPYVLTAPQ